jgi:filamentous hemagglutinin family protein
MRLLARHSKRDGVGEAIFWISACLVFFGTLSMVALAGPEGAQVVQGEVSFQQSGDNTVITASDQSIVNYNSFDIARPEVVEFVQPSSRASILNRILSAEPTAINGTLLANGRVFFVNPAGVIIGDGARINVSQLIASGLDLSNESFLSGQYEFAGGDGAVANYGDISADGVYLIGKEVINAGTIQCPEGYVLMASGDRVFLGQPGSDVIVEVGVLEPSDQTNPVVSGQVINEGSVEAGGGTVILAAAGDVFSKPIVSNIGSLSGHRGPNRERGLHNCCEQSGCGRHGDGGGGRGGQYRNRGSLRCSGGYRGGGSHRSVGPVWCGSCRRHGGRWR